MKVLHFRERESVYELDISDPFYLKDPTNTDLGIRIITTGSLLIEEQGYTNFTLKKLATDINSVEASVYRYFESKEHLLFYLLSSYWSLIELRLSFVKASSSSPKVRLHKCIDVLLGVDDIEILGVKSALEFKVLQSIARKNYYFSLSLLGEDERGRSMYKLFLNHMHSIKNELSDMLHELIPKFSNVGLLADTILKKSLYSDEGLHLAELPPNGKGHLKLAEFVKELISKLR